MSRIDLFFDLLDFEHSDIFKEIEDSPWEALTRIKSYLQERVTKNQVLGDVHPQAIIEGEGVYIAPTAKVEATAYIKGPVWIGEGTEVRHGAYVRGQVITGTKAVIGHATEVKNSIFLNDAKAGHFAYVGDSILGTDVNLGAGTKLANLKMTKDEVHLRIEGKKVGSGLRKFGALLGDGVEMGCNSVANPGTVLAKRSLVYPCVSVFGYHSEVKRFKS